MPSFVRLGNGQGTLSVYPTVLAENKVALVELAILPNRVVNWIPTGAITVIPLSIRTNERGVIRAKIVPNPGAAGTTASIRVEYVL